MADSYTTKLSEGVPAVIPTEALTSNQSLQFSQTQGDNLSSYFSGFSNIQSLLDKYFTSDLESQRNTQINDLKGALEQYGNKATRTQAIGEQYGIPQDIESLKKLNLQIAERLGQAGIQEQQQQGIGNVASTANAYSSNSRRMALAEVGALQAKQAALQGNIELSQKLVQQAVDVEFAPVENKINSIQEFLKLNADQLSRADKKKADALELILNQQKLQLGEQKAEKQDVINLSNKYLDAGILPTDTLQQAQDKALKSNSYRSELQKKTGLTDYQQLNALQDIQGKLNKSVQDSSKAISYANIANSIYDQYKAGKVNLSTAVQTVVNSFNKVLDPSSVVREGEYARTQQGQSLLDRAYGLYLNLAQGGSGVTPDTLSNLITAINSFSANAKNYITTAEKNARAQADLYGLPSEYLKSNAYELNAPIDNQSLSGLQSLSNQDFFNTVSNGGQVNQSTVEKVGDNQGFFSKLFSFFK